MATQVTTTLLTPRRAALTDWLRQFDPWTIAALAVVIVASLAYAWQARPVAPPVATVQPVILIATARPEPTADTIAVAAATLRLQGAVVAYDAPGGRVLGAIDSGRAYEIIARSGLDWMQLRIAGSGDIWALRVAVEGEVPDIATPQPPPPAQEIVIMQAPAEAAATPAPQPTAAPEPAFRVGGCSAIEAAAKCSRTLPQR